MPIAIDLEGREAAPSIETDDEDGVGTGNTECRKGRIDRIDLSDRALRDLQFVPFVHHHVFVGPRKDADRVIPIGRIDRSLERRGGKVYVDTLQNGHGRLIAAPFSVRPRPGAPVSTPLDWDEVGPDLDPARLTMDTVPERTAARTQENGKLPEDIPPADNDSALEAQIRKAAIEETDPELKKRLWDEYRRYKGLPVPN